MNGSVKVLILLSVFCALLLPVSSWPDLILSENLHSLLLPPTSAGPVKCTLMSSCRGHPNGVKFGCRGHRHGVKFGFQGLPNGVKFGFREHRNRVKFQSSNKKKLDFLELFVVRIYIYIYIFFFYIFPQEIMPTGLMVPILKIVLPPLKYLEILQYPQPYYLI